MKTKRLAFAAWAALAAATLAACGDGPGGPIPPRGGTRVLLTDAPFPFDLVSRVDVFIVGVAASETADTTSPAYQWIDIVQPMTTFNLLDFQRGATAIVGDGELPAGQYQAVRLVIDTDHSSITYRDGSTAAVRWDVAGELALHALVEEPVAVDNDGAEIVIDFDVGRSFLYNVVPLDTLNPQSTDGFVFIPWIRAVNEAATGSIAGTVTDEAGNPVEYATVNILRGDLAAGPLTWGSVATGATDAEGTYRVDFVLPGDYIIRAHPPTTSDLGATSASGVTVSVGTETTQDLTLPEADAVSLEIVGPATVEVGHEIVLQAVIRNADDEPLLGQAVSWMVGPAGFVAATDPSGGAPTGDLALLRGLNQGVVSVIASSFGLADSTNVTITDPNAAPVAAVDLSPATQTVSVFDSLTIAVTLRDAAGNALTGRQVVWEVSDPAVLAPTGAATTLILTTPQSVHFTALSTGSVTVTAQSEGKKGTAQVVVN